MISAQARRFVLIAFAYLGPLGVVSMLGARRDADIQWHARHGLMLFLVEAVVVGTLAAATAVVALSNLAAGAALGALTWTTWLAALALQLAAVIVALNGGRLMVPVVSRMVARLMPREASGPTG